MTVSVGDPVTVMGHGSEFPHRGMVMSPPGYGVFSVYAKSTDTQVLVFRRLSCEGSWWIRGHHEPGSAEYEALCTAFALVAR